MDNDDEIKGRILSRREMFGVLGGLGAAALLAACSDNGDSPSQTAATAAGNGAAPSANLTGRFEIEDHETEEVLGVLLVQPR
jgi:hypothetical protein